MNSEVQEIREMLLTHIDEHLSFLMSKFDQHSSLLEVELQIKRDLNEYGKILLEKLFPIIYGDGYYGSVVEEKDPDESGEPYFFSCVLRKQTRALKTIFGDIKITRAYYQDDQTGGSIGLLDRNVGIHNKKISPAVRYYAGLLGITTSYSEAEDQFLRFTGIQVSRKDIDLFTQEKANEVTAHFSERIQDIPVDSQNNLPPANIHADISSERIVYLEADGCFVPVKKEFEENDDDWKECKTLLLFETENEIIESGGKKKIKHKIIRKNNFSSVKGIGYFKRQVKCELEQYCKNDKVKIVCIGDGASWIWNMVKELIPKGRIEILDWYHVKEKITLLAAAVFNKEKQDTEKEIFVTHMKGLLFTGEHDQAIQELKDLYANTKSRDKQALIYNTIGYFENNKDRMNYQEYEKLELCIGSGAVESANKNVIQRRIKLPGCRWTQHNADQMAHIRSEYINGNIDQWFGLKYNPMLASAT